MNVEGILLQNYRYFVASGTATTGFTLVGTPDQRRILRAALSIDVGGVGSITVNNAAGPGTTITVPPGRTVCIEPQGAFMHVLTMTITSGTGFFLVEGVFIPSGV